MNLDDLKSTIERFKAGAITEAELAVLRRGLQDGDITLVQGERAVAAGGDLIDSVVVTGSGNIIFNGDNAAEQQILARLVSPRPHQLPGDLKDFTGRDQEIEELMKPLTQVECVAITTIGGMGGVGKSALAVHVAHRLADRYPDGKVFVQMYGTSGTPLTTIQAMARVIQSFRPEAQVADDLGLAARDYRNTLAGKRALILLDNAPNAGLVRPLVPSPPCTMIITSQRVIILEGARSVSLDSLSDKDARGLLREILGEGRATDAQFDIIAQMCGRLPLALRVAGTFLAAHRDWTVEEYIHTLSDERQRLALLKQDDLDVEATLSLSAMQLERENPDLAVRWQLLAVFPADFDRAAAAAVWDVAIEEARDSLSALLGRSLLLYDEIGARYRLHDLVRLFTDEHVDDTERAAGQERHAGHYATVLRKADALYLQGGEAVKQGLAMLDVEWRNLLAGETWAASNSGTDDFAAELSSDYSTFGAHTLDLVQHPRDRIRWLETALSSARRLNKRSVEGAHLGNLGAAHFKLGQTDRAIEYFEQHLAISRQIGDRRGEGQALGNLGAAYFNLAQMRRAIEYYEQALMISHEIGDRHAEEAALGNLGGAYFRLGQARRAIDYYEQALIIGLEIGDRLGEGKALGNLGLAYLNLGEAHLAIEYHRQALGINRDLRARQGEAANLSNLGLAHAALGEASRAIEYHKQALSIHREIGDRKSEGANLGDLGLAYAALGETRRAIEHYEQHLSIAREIGDRHGEGCALGNLGLGYATLGETCRAIEFYRQALAIDCEIGDRRGEGINVGNLGLAYGALGETQRAIEQHEQYLAISREIGDQRGEGTALGNLGNAFAALGETRRAIEYHEQYLAIAREVGDRHGEGNAHGNLGNALEELGETRRAIEHYQQHLAIAREVGDKPAEGRTLFNISLLLDRLGNRVEAILNTRAALRIFEEIESPYADRARDQLARWRALE